MKFDAVKDSGQRRAFGTGSVRDVRDGKGRFDLLSPIAMSRLAQHTENGAKKYGDRNWEKGQPLSSYLDSALRHINKFREGLRDEDHMAAAMWNIQGFIHTEEMIRRGRLPKDLDDMVSYLSNDPMADGPRTPEAVKFAEDHLGERAEEIPEWKKRCVVSKKEDGCWDVESEFRTHYLSIGGWVRYSGPSADIESARRKIGIWSTEKKARKFLRKMDTPPTPPPSDGPQLLLTTSDGTPLV